MTEGQLGRTPDALPPRSFTSPGTHPTVVGRTGGVPVGSWLSVVSRLTAGFCNSRYRDSGPGCGSHLYAICTHCPENPPCGGITPLSLSCRCPVDHLTGRFPPVSPVGGPAPGHLPLGRLYTLVFGARSHLARGSFQPRVIRLPHPPDANIGTQRACGTVCTPFWVRKTSVRSNRVHGVREKVISDDLTGVRCSEILPTQRLPCRPGKLLVGKLRTTPFYHLRTVRRKPLTSLSLKNRVHGVRH